MKKTNDSSGVKIWVDPDFRIFLKKKAAEEEKTVIELTRDFARGSVSREKDDVYERKKPFSFRI